MPTTSRRKFLSAISTAAAFGGAGMISLAPRAPQFLLQSAALGAEHPGERVLVVVQMTGGNDGLNTVVPYADEVYRQRRRASLAIGAGNVLKIDNSIGLNPSLKGMATLLEARQLAILQGVGYPNPNRSHFESMDIWHTVHTQLNDRTTGWLGRGLDAQQLARRSVDPPALHLGAEVQPLALTGRDVPTPSIRSLDQFRLDTGNSKSQRGAIEAAAVAKRESASDLLAFVQTRTTSAYEVSRRLEQSGDEYKTSVNYPQTQLAQKLKRVAQLIDAGLTTRVYYVSLDGFDTHSDQAAVHGALLQQLGDALAAFAEDLQVHSHLDRVATLVFSEFGRRVEENASRGTDHGAAAPAFVVGSKVRSGLIGKHPSLTDLPDGDIKFHTDFRTIYAALLQQWLGWPAEPILGSGFQPAHFLS